MHRARQVAKERAARDGFFGSDGITDQSDRIKLLTLKAALPNHDYSSPKRSSNSAWTAFRASRASEPSVRTLSLVPCAAPSIMSPVTLLALVRSFPRPIITLDENFAAVWA